MRRGDVEGALDAAVLEGVHDHADHVVNVDPTPPGATQSDRTAQAQLERHEQALKRAAVGREDDPEAQCGGPHAGCGCCGFPILAETSEEVVAWGRGF